MSSASRTRANGAAQHREKLLDANFIFFLIAGMREKTGIEFFGEQRVLETLDGPFEHGSDQRGIDVRANFAARETEAHGRGGAIRIFGDEKAVDFALEFEIDTVISHQ